MSDMHTGMQSSGKRLGPRIREHAQATAHVIDLQRVQQSFLQPRIMMEQNTCASTSFGTPLSFLKPPPIPLVRVPDCV